MTESTPKVTARPPLTGTTLADVPTGSTVLVRAKVRRHADHEQWFTDLLIEHDSGYRDSGAGSARIFKHHDVTVEVVDE